MDGFILDEVIARVRQMEMYFDLLKKAEKENPASLQSNPWTKEFLRVLTEYYEGGQWLCDYETDEKGLLPDTLKRGVLSQDAVYDFLDRIKTEKEN
ncbi:MAG: DUF4298 domain-containing protein [Clostridia bacterium]|nr:DUF4298 domain-containing protein [Clostridia bacterium]